MHKHKIFPLCFSYGQNKSKPWCEAVNAMCSQWSVTPYFFDQLDTMTPFLSLFFFLYRENFADCLLVAPKDTMSRNFAEKTFVNTHKTLKFVKICFSWKFSPLYGILSLASNQTVVFLFFCCWEKMNWRKQTQLTHLFTWVVNWSSPKFPVNYCASQFVKVISWLSVLSYQEAYVLDHCHTWYIVIETEGFSCLQLPSAAFYSTYRCMFTANTTLPILIAWRRWWSCLTKWLRLYPVLRCAYGCNPDWSSEGEVCYLYMVVLNSIMTVMCAVRPGYDEDGCNPCWKRGGRWVQ